MARRLILDTGAVLGYVSGDRRVGALVKAAHESRSDVVIPPVVVTQVIRGGGRDARIHRLINASTVSFVGLRTARRAGELLGSAGLTDVADAQVVAEALRAGPSTIVTGDVRDITTLAGDAAGREVLIAAI